MAHPRRVLAFVAVHGRQPTTNLTVEAGFKPAWGSEKKAYRRSPHSPNGSPPVPLPHNLQVRAFIVDKLTQLFPILDHMSIGSHNRRSYPHVPNLFERMGPNPRSRRAAISPLSQSPAANQQPTSP